jgi:hypothetical protein
LMAVNFVCSNQREITNHVSLLSPRDSGEGSNSGCLSVRHTFLFTR